VSRQFEHPSGSERVYHGQPQGWDSEDGPLREVRRVREDSRPTLRLPNQARKDGGSKEIDEDGAPTKHEIWRIEVFPSNKSIEGTKQQIAEALSLPTVVDSLTEIEMTLIDGFQTSTFGAGGEGVDL